LNNVARSKNQFKYNGQEFQDELELNMTAMDFRQYDNALGRFHGVDLLAEIDYSGSPYSFGFNNPVFFSDPSGLTPQEGGHEPPTNANNPIELDEVVIVKPPKKNTGSPFMDMSFAPLISSAGGLGFGIIGNNGSGVGAIGIGPYSIAGHVPLSTNLEIVSSAELKNMVSVSNTIANTAPPTKKPYSSWFFANQYFAGEASLKAGTFVDVGIRKIFQVTLGEYTEKGYKWEYYNYSSKITLEFN
jgi:RHS repeat-associated protein